MSTTTQTKKQSQSKQTAKMKNKVFTFRFTATPKMQAVLEQLENTYSMLDKTEIVKLALSKLINENTTTGFETEEPKWEEITNEIETLK